MALHTDLPIYKTGVELVTLAVNAQAQMPRSVKRTLGEKINQHCMEMLDRMAMANATQREERAAHIAALLKHVRSAQILFRVSHDCRHLSPRLWATSVQLLDSIGKQGGGWLKSASHRKAPAA